jgi:protein-disulfide isomerase
MLLLKSGFTITVSLVLLVSFVPSEDERFKNKMKQVIENNPTLISEVLRQNPTEFIHSVEEALILNRRYQEQFLAQAQKEKLTEALIETNEVLIREDELIRGPSVAHGANLLLVQYLDFDCPLSARSFFTVQTLLDEYQDRLQFVVKHLPHEMHPNAMISAQFYEALRLQAKELAVNFHDQLFLSHENLRRGESFLNNMAHDLGSDMHRLELDLYSQEVEERIKQDITEAHSFGIRATPAFLLNGIVITGAYPIDHFRALIEKLEGQSLIEH